MCVSLVHCLALFSTLMQEPAGHPLVEAVNSKTRLTWRNFLIYMNAEGTWNYLVVQITTVVSSFALVFGSMYLIYEYVLMVNP